MQNNFSNLPPLEEMVSSPQTLKKEFKLFPIEKLGQGGFGKVYAGTLLGSPASAFGSEWFHRQEIEES